ncbi:MAG: 50S ribosomal protein L24e [Candidatus Aenigmarchaeota archaeon]|nr:50S ribosomal protein L24e [Candidatus Aenigmarchaeota archaeon]
MKCSFCGSNITRGTGKMFVRNTGEIFYWCSSKCEKNFRMGRERKKLRWIKREKKRTVKKE